MKDRLSKYPGRVKLTPVAGQADTFDMIRADEPENEGTPLNKNTFLTDETAEEMGLDPASDPTPNDALAALMARMLADGNGIMQKMMQMLKGDSDVGIMNGENKKIFGYGVDGKFYTGDPEYPLTFRGSGGVPTYNGVNMPQVQKGSYTGTGTVGVSNKRSLTFNFLPQFVFIFGVSGSWPHFMVATESSVGMYLKGSSSSTGAYNTISWSGNTMTWHGSSEEKHMNISGAKYIYIAIG